MLLAAFCKNSSIVHIFFILIQKMPKITQFKRQIIIFFHQQSESKLIFQWCAVCPYKFSGIFILVSLNCCNYFPFSQQNGKKLMWLKIFAQYSIYKRPSSTKKRKEKKGCVFSSQAEDTAFCGTASSLDLGDRRYLYFSDQTQNFPF